MKLLHLLALSAAMAVLPLFATTEADAQQRNMSGLRITLPSHANHFSWERHHGFHGGVFIVERALRQAQDEREVVREPLRQAQDERLREVAVTPPPTPPHQGEGRKRKPYVIGGTYASLPPQGCMKMIEDGASYYFCSGQEWYRQLGTGRVAKYRAVARP